MGLRNTDNNMERAVDWIFSHPDGEPEAAAGAGGATGGDSRQGDLERLRDGEPR